MAIDLFSMIVAGGISWGIGKILDVFISCDLCGQKDRVRIGNVQFNNLGCSNCYREIVQFTNASDFTVDQKGRVGHVGAKLLGDYSLNVNPAEERIYEGWLYFYVEARALDMLNRQFVLSCEILDFESGIIVSKGRSEIYTSAYQDSRWYEGAFLAVRWDQIPDAYRDNRIFAIDLKVRSEYGHLLCEHRRLEKLWK